MLVVLLLPLWDLLDMELSEMAQLEGQQEAAGEEEGLEPTSDSPPTPEVVGIEMVVIAYFSRNIGNGWQKSSVTFLMYMGTGQSVFGHLSFRYSCSPTSLSQPSRMTSTITEMILWCS